MKQQVLQLAFPLTLGVISEPLFLLTMAFITENTLVRRIDDHTRPCGIVVQLHQRRRTSGILCHPSYMAASTRGMLSGRGGWLAMLLQFLVSPFFFLVCGPFVMGDAGSDGSYIRPG
jgi:hypothetical protein